MLKIKHFSKKALASLMLAGLCFCLCSINPTSGMGQSQTKVGHVNGDGTMVLSVSSGTLVGAFNNEFYLHESTRMDTVTSVSLFYNGNYYLRGVGHAGTDNISGWALLTKNGSNDLYLSTSVSGPGTCRSNGCQSCDDDQTCPCTDDTAGRYCTKAAVNYYYGSGNLGGFY